MERRTFLTLAGGLRALPLAARRGGGCSCRHRSPGRSGSAVAPTACGKVSREAGGFEAGRSCALPVREGKGDPTAVEAAARTR